MFFICRKIATVIRSFLGKPVEFAFFEQDERDPGCRFRTTTFAGEKCLLTRSIFRDSLKCSTVIPRSQPISVTGANSITRQTTTTWPHSTSSGPNGHLKGSCKGIPMRLDTLAKYSSRKPIRNRHTSPVRDSELCPASRSVTAYGSRPLASITLVIEEILKTVST